MRVLIVEDEPVIARRLDRMLCEIVEDRDVKTHTIHCFQEARSYLFKTPIDLLLLDLNLSGRDGFDLLKLSVSGAFHTIIVSAHTDQALRAFEYGVLDFIGKPFKKERLQKALNRLDEVHHRPDPSMKYLAVRTAGRIDLIAVEDVAYIKGAGAYSEIVLSNGSRELHDKSLEQLHTLLGDAFERIHRSYLVKVDEIAQFTVSEGSRYGVVLESGEELPVGRTRYKEVRARLELSG
jgi:DNA-binding LytR/AlgR family response regulator